MPLHARRLEASLPERSRCTEPGAERGNPRVELRVIEDIVATKPSPVWSSIILVSTLASPAVSRTGTPGSGVSTTAGTLCHWPRTERLPEALG